MEKSVERCELSIVEGQLANNEEEADEEDSLESKLIIKLHCKHGVILFSIEFPINLTLCWGRCNKDSSIVNADSSIANGSRRL